MIWYTNARGIRRYGRKIAANEISSNPCTRSHSLAAMFKAYNNSNLVTFTVLTDSSTPALSRLRTEMHRHMLFSLSSSGKICHILLRAVYRPTWRAQIVPLVSQSWPWRESRRNEANSDDVTSICGEGNRMNYWTTFSFPQMWTGSNSQSLNCLRNDFDSPQWIRPWFSLIKSFRDLFIGQFTRLHTSCQLVTQLISSDGSCSVHIQDVVH